MEVRPEKLKFFESVLCVYVVAAEGPQLMQPRPKTPKKADGEASRRLKDVLTLQLPSRFSSLFLQPEAT